MGLALDKSKFMNFIAYNFTEQFQQMWYSTPVYRNNTKISPLEVVGDVLTFDLHSYQAHCNKHVIITNLGQIEVIPKTMFKVFLLGWKIAFREIAQIKLKWNS